MVLMGCIYGMRAKYLKYLWKCVENRFPNILIRLGSAWGTLLEVQLGNNQRQGQLRDYGGTAAGH
jgi:hypothetical protein